MYYDRPLFLYQSTMKTNAACLFLSHIDVGEAPSTSKHSSERWWWCDEKTDRETMGESKDEREE